MKQLVVISGKGGTGKTTLVACFAFLAENKVLADCDVDAADLYLLFDPAIKHKEKFMGGKKAFIDKESCTDCGECLEVCRFDAISQDFVVDKIACEGCGVCVRFCPVNAIDFNHNVSGEWFIADTRYGPLVYAKLGIAEENSGKLVSVVRRNAKRIAEEKGCGLIITDGPPGIGCPVISSITGADLVLVITEPTSAGIHDMERVISLSRHFRAEPCVCVNKYDLNLDKTKEIEDFCSSRNIPLIGKIPYDDVVTQALMERKPVVEYSQNQVASSIRSIWDKTKAKLSQEVKPKIG